MVFASVICLSVEIFDTDIILCEGDFNNIVYLAQRIKKITKFRKFSKKGVQ